MYTFFVEDFQNGSFDFNGLIRDYVSFNNSGPRPLGLLVSAFESISFN